MLSTNSVTHKFDRLNVDESPWNRSELRQRRPKLAIRFI